MDWPFHATLAAFVLLASPLDGYARVSGDPQEGRVLAERSCASCHGIDAKTRSPDPRAPAFRRVAQTPGMTAVALRAALQTSHRTMPNIVLSKQERENVIAYILSLKGPGS